MSFSQIQASNLRDQVADQIRSAIIEGRLRPNDHIVEAELTAQLGVSRTPVREALILLEQDGLVVSYPYRGSFVRNFTPQDVKDIFSMRTVLENFAAELIIDRLTNEEYNHLDQLIEAQRQAIAIGDLRQIRSIDMNFHHFIVSCSQHSLLIRNWKQIVAQIFAVLHIRAWAIPNYDEYKAIRDHLAILNAYKQRDLPTLMSLNREINERVAGECVYSVEQKGSA
ncbi:MAG: GntR family transcriptional regulator [Anaerolineae bacterium]|nr:GntR family transcriptional regulator [Anaerolineae bacterium]MDW8172701.1 GntR family transcriptional regulator [Anaerolineae bacterium]